MSKPIEQLKSSEFYTNLVYKIAEQKVIEICKLTVFLVENDCNK